MTDKAYRPSVGILLFNRQQHVWCGRRSNIYPRPADTSKLWQFPQGGIDEGEDPLQAAKRELLEETGVHSVRLLHEHKPWLYYDLPESWGSKLFNGKYKGQKQKWFAFAFEGQETEFNLNAHTYAEFDQWQWRPLAECPQYVVDFKRSLYEDLAKIFAPFAYPAV